MSEQLPDLPAQVRGGSHEMQEQNARIEPGASQMGERARIAETWAADAEKRAQAAEAKAEVAARQARAAAILAQALRHQKTAAANQAQALRDQLAAVYNSTSWRITAPLRALAMSMQRFRGSPVPRAPTAAQEQPSSPQPGRLPTRRSPRPTIFIECSNTSQEELNTGIQRVVRNLVRNAKPASEKYGFNAAAVVMADGRLVPADTARLFADKTRASPIEKPTAWQITETLDDYESHVGNVLLLLDASWWIPEIWAATERFKAMGGYVIGVIHDLVPVTHPHTTDETLTIIFAEWLENLLRVTDSIITVSRTVHHQLEVYLQATGWSSNGKPSIPISFFYHGSELDLIDTSKPPRQHIQDIFSPQTPTFIVVGTIEPRKNPAFTLAAFDAAWRDGVEAKLVIIGRHAWKSDDFLNCVRTHPLFMTKLFLLRDVTDEELDYAYRHASALIIPSQIEGFGLPVAEAFQRGLPVMCSDIPVFREIADGRAIFFGLEDAKNLTEALKQFVQQADPTQPKKCSQLNWQTWRQSAEQLFGEIAKAVSARASCRQAD
jgi:glycosyltransferase involved in cell wall biosynthesis